MAKILFVTSGLYGMLHPAVEFARRLARAGHQVTYASFADAREAVVGNGIDFLELEPSRYPAFLAADAKAGTLLRLRHLRSRRQRALESLAVGSLRPALSGVDPDLIVIDVEMHEHVIAASASGVPLALLNSFVSIWRQPGLPPPHCLARPGVGWKGSRLGSWLLWRALRLRKRRKAWSQMARRIGCDRLSLLRQLARESNFDLRRETDRSQWLIPFNYRRLPSLTVHAREFDFPHRPPETVHHVGPMLLESRTDARVTPTIRSQLQTIFKECRGGERALIYAGFGSFFSTDLTFLRRLIEAVARRHDWDLVISLGGRLEPADLGPLPKRVHAFGWLPQVDVLRHADVAVTHGGTNTVDECVLCGVPLLIYCGFETDMAGTTSRVVHHGLGLVGDQQRDSPRVIGDQIDRLLREPHFRSRVERMRTRYAAYVEKRVAEQVIESILGRGRARTGP